METGLPADLLELELTESVLMRNTESLHEFLGMLQNRGVRFTIDFGGTSLVALNARGIHHNTIDAILLTHIHSDHSSGVPIMLVDQARKFDPIKA